MDVKLPQAMLDLQMARKDLAELDALREMIKDLNKEKRDLEELMVDKLREGANSIANLQQELFNSKKENKKLKEALCGMQQQAQSLSNQIQDTQTQIHQMAEQTRLNK